MYIYLYMCLFICFDNRLQNTRMHPKANGEIGIGDQKGICCWTEHISANLVAHLRRLMQELRVWVRGHRLLWVPSRRQQALLVVEEVVAVNWINIYEIIMKSLREKKTINIDHCLCNGAYCLTNGKSFFFPEVFNVLML